MKKTLLPLASLITMFSGVPVFAQATSISVGGATVTAPDASNGRTENLSLTTGSRTSLTVGNATSFGASSNLSTSGGLTALTRSVLIPASVSITSKIGDNSLQQTKIDISNLSAKGEGGTINPLTSSAVGGEIQIGDNTQYASGTANIIGMGATVALNIDPLKGVADGSDIWPTGVPRSEASFLSTVFPNIYQEREYLRDANGDVVYDSDGNAKYVNIAEGAACAPSATNECSYTSPEKLVSGNASASANLTTSTNIDINASSFMQTFGQAF